MYLSKTHLLTLCFFLGMSGLIGLFSFTNHSAQPEKEYMSIVISRNEAGAYLTAHISINGQEYVKEDLRSKYAGNRESYDLNPVIQLLLEYQRGGWQVAASSMDSRNPGAQEEKILNYFFLERKAPEFKK